MANIDVTELIKFLTKEEKSINLRDGLMLFINNLSIRVRPDSVHEAKTNTEWIINYLESIGVISTNQLSSDAINQFINYSKSRNNKESTINKRIKSLSRMLNYLVDEEVISNNPIKKFKLLKENKSEIKFVDNETALQVIKAAYQKTLNNDFFQLRNFYGLLIMFEQGLRLNELMHLHESNFDYKNNSIKLTYTKTNKERTIFLNEDLMIKIKKFVIDHNLKNNYFMINKKTNLPIDKRDFAKWLNKIGKELGIEQSISPHKWRHGFATTSLQSGADLNYIKEILGHSSIGTTEIYLHIQNQYLENQHKKFSKLSELAYRL